MLQFTVGMRRAPPSHLRVGFLLIALATLQACAQTEPVDLPGDEQNTNTGARRDSGRQTRPTDAGSDLISDGSPDVVSEVGADIAQDLATDLSTDNGADTEDVAPGASCTPASAAAVCGGLPCVDGYCCDESCDGTCRACNVRGSEGRCVHHAQGSDPDNDCAPTAGETCGTTGLCDGAGACAYFGGATSCDDGETCSINDACDGGGACRGEIPPTCGPGEGNECCAGTCSDVTGCATVATPCPDVCTATELTIGASCTGCGGAGAVGACTGAVSHRCDAGEHSPCQALSCAGVTYWCSELGGTWAWRPSSSCDDDALCTYDDRCVAGSCRGTAIDCSDDTCADRECNGTDACTVDPNPSIPCEDGDLCSYNDMCDGEGTCQPGPSVTCVDTACIDRACVGDGTCSQVVLTNSSCEDGDLCTYGDTCDSEGDCNAGDSLSCDGLDTTCLGYACDGTDTCAATPHNIGGTCDDDNSFTDNDQCQADGSCLGDEGCPPPVESCTDGNQNRRGCGGARVIGRVGASASVTINADTCSARDDFEDSSSCWDANNDHSYRLYMREGEIAQIRYRTGDGCFDSSWNGTLKVFETAGCSSTGCGSKVYCDYNERDQTTTYTAVRDGWIIIVADGSHASDDEGAYALTVNLTCRHAGCECD